MEKKDDENVRTCYMCHKCEYMTPSIIMIRKHNKSKKHINKEETEEIMTKERIYEIGRLNENRKRKQAERRDNKKYLFIV
jgi:hypothetical protein